jgi:hypothetical protein
MGPVALIGLDAADEQDEPHRRRNGVRSVALGERPVSLVAIILFDFLEDVGHNNPGSVEMLFFSRVRRQKAA